MRVRVIVSETLVGVTGLVVLYPLLLAVNRMYVRLPLPWMQGDWTMFMILISPPLLLFSGGFLVLVGRAPARALGGLFLAVDVWWVFMLLTTGY